MRRLMITSNDGTAEKKLGMHWLIRLRWMAVLGQVLLCLVVDLFFGIRLPAAILAACIGFTALSNAVLVHQRRRATSAGAWVKPLILGGDIVVLTIMLYFTGGAHNPFTMFYLLHITMAVILLPAWGAWGAVALCTAGFWALFHSQYALESDSGATCCNDMTAHLRGMVVAMVLTGCGVAYFVGRLTAGLRESRHMIALARADGENARRTMEVATLAAGIAHELATLAAGIAHELATPLGTIAIVSQDLETMVGETCGNSSCAADARLIRQEVERCRVIIEKLGRTSQKPEEDSRPLEWNDLADLLSGYISEPVRERLELRVQLSSVRPLFPQSRLFQCLSILIKNAAEAAPPVTPVTLDAEIRQSHCVFRVSDQGPGFPPGFEQRIGEPMVTTKSKAGGLGLGLYLVKAFVVEHGGKLRVDAGPHGETVVEMLLPLIKQEP
jgi:two-component system sensor histidine kinase RegB